MSLKIYDSALRKKVAFQPLIPNQVKIYVCGVTVYDHCHIGHGRAYVTFDLMVRYLKFLGFEVTYVRNITDIDDKIINKAKEISGDLPLLEKTKKVTEEFTGIFHETMDKLGLLKPDQEPRATDHIAEMIQLIEQLIKNGVAYQNGSDVWFDIDQWKEYGSLSGKALEDLKAGARVEVAAQKKNPLDFALWKGSKEGEPSWDAPWGEGRPGWHLECSAMSMKYLGAPFDIHGGGQDLLFPHHENEKAQSEAGTGKEFAKYWLHNGFVTINQEKMSKSLGNFFILKDVFERFNPMVVRYYYLTQHYRTPMEFNVEVLEEIQEPYRKIQNCLSLTDLLIQKQGLKELDPASISDSKSIQQFKSYMDDDFNTPKALALIHELVGAINGEREKRKEETLLLENVAALKLILSVLGLQFNEEKVELIGDGAQEKYLTEEKVQELLQSDCSLEQLHLLAQSRQDLRKQKRFDLADAIRDKIAESGYVLEDTPEGARLRKQ